jgi:FixJ family two-component response regulator
MGIQEPGVLEPLGFSERHVIVCVDDDRGVLSALYRLLRGESYEIITTGDPERAVDRSNPGGST